MYRQGKITLEQAQNLFNKYGIAVICEGDLREYHIAVDHVIKYIKNEA